MLQSCPVRAKRLPASLNWEIDRVWPTVKQSMINCTGVVMIYSQAIGKSQEPVMILIYSVSIYCAHHKNTLNVM